MDSITFKDVFWQNGTNNGPGGVLQPPALKIIWVKRNPLNDTKDAHMTSNRCQLGTHLEGVLIYINAILVFT